MFGEWPTTASHICIREKYWPKPRHRVMFEIKTGHSMQYKLTFGRNTQIVPAIILPALILLVPLVLFLEFADPQLLQSEWLPITLSLVYFLSVLFLTLRLVSFATASIEISVASDMLQFSFPEKNIFHHTDFNISFQDIINIGEDNDKGYDFLYFQTRHGGFKKFHITAKEGDAQFAAFRDHVVGKGALFNTSSHIGGTITNKSVYQKWPMKTLAVLLLFILLAFPLVSFYIGTNWRNNVSYWIVVLSGVPIVAKVYFHNFVK